ncbi:DUF805 domain-containing protein [Lysobacter terrae]
MEQINNFYLNVIKNHYFDFVGRARRQEYWMFTLFNVIACIALSLIFGLIKMPWLAGLYSFAILLPGIGVTARRLHDIGKSGWFMLVALIPVVGLYLIYLLAQDSEMHTNAYGPNPKAVVRHP